MKIRLFQNDYNEACVLLLMPILAGMLQISMSINAMDELTQKQRRIQADEAYRKAHNIEGEDRTFHIKNLKQAASMGHPEACFELAQGYYRKMVIFITAKKGDSQKNQLCAEIFYNEGIYYFTKQDRQSFKRGEELLKEATWNGSIQAQKALVQHYYDRAVVYFQKAIALGHAGAREELALLERQKVVFDASITMHPSYIQ